MKMNVKTCCCCCSLKYGFFAFSIVNMMLRISWAASLYFISIPSLTTGNEQAEIKLRIQGFGFGWFISTCVVIFVALRGIIQRRSILLYPYLVLIVLEVLVEVALLVIWVSTDGVAPTYLASFFIICAIEIYCFICLKSLYQQLKEEERQMHDSTPKPLA